MDKLKILFMLVLMSCLVSGLDDLMSLQGKVDQSGVLVDGGDIVVEIWDSSTGGTLIYNSTSDFNSAIIGGFFDIVLGSGSNSLTLNLTQLYYMDIAIEGQDIDWGGDERRRFQSTVGAPKFDEDVWLNNTLYTKEDNVGINDASPSHTLSVNGNLSLDSTVYASCTSLETDAGGGVRCGSDDGGDLSGIVGEIVFMNESLLNDSYARLNENNTFSDSSFFGGLVGIGTTTPGYNLEVNGDANISGTIYSNSSSVGIGTDVPGAQFHLSSSSFYPMALESTGGSGTGIEWFVSGTKTWNTFTNTGGLFSFHNTTDTVLVLEAGGNLGVAVTTPKYKLEVNSPTDAMNVSGNLYVNESSVGIGTENPGYGLEVNNEANISGNLYVNSSSIGIGTNVPSGEVHMVGSSDTMNVVVESPESENSIISFQGDGTGMGYSIGRWDSGDQDNFAIGRSGSDWPFVMNNGGQIGLGTSSPTYTLSVHNQSVGMNVSGMLYVNSTNVGIGTSSPDSTLDVLGSTTASTSAVQVVANAENVAQFLFENVKETTGQEDNFKIGYYDSTWGSSQDNTSILRVVSNGTISSGCSECTQLDLIHTGKNSETNFYAMSVRNGTNEAVFSYIRHDGSAYFDGGVGIGTPTPLTTLQPKNSVAFDQSATESGQDNIFLESGVSDGAGNYGASIGFSRLDTTNGRRAAIAAVQSFNDNDNVGLAFFTHDSSTAGDNLIEAMRIQSSGMVGINTTSPTHELTVVGDVNITGDLLVQGQNTTVPDYVFEKGYNLKKLDELEAYININKKLPPSDIQGGFLVGGGNNILRQMMFLLEKVEELTLYTIEQEKTINELEGRIEVLENS